MTSVKEILGIDLYKTSEKTSDSKKEKKLGKSKKEDEKKIIMIDTSLYKNFVTKIKTSKHIGYNTY